MTCRTRDAFTLLEAAAVITPDLADRLKKMVGFRNIAIHGYRKLDIEIVRRIVVERLDDFVEFTRVLLKS